MKNRLNILYILADDLGWGDIGLHGARIKTPNIDRLAATGVELRRHYVNPTCTPTRASLLTGKYQGRFGVHATSPTNCPVLPDGYETLAGMVKNGGYATGLFGKWHLGSSPEYSANRYGFDYSYGSLAGGVDPYNHMYKKGEYSRTWHRNGELIDEQGHVTDLITSEAVGWIRETKSPWFCYVPFTAVHIPVKAPQQWQDRYAGDTFDEDPDRNYSYLNYAAYTSQMDHAVGRLVETLAELNQRQDTIIVFASDNGALYSYPLEKTQQYPGYQEDTPMLGSNLPFRGQKAQLYEGGIRTPAIVNLQGTLEPGVRDQPFHIADWMPTLSRLVECEPAEDPGWDGTDIWPVIAGEAETTENRTIYWNVKGVSFALCDGDWKIISDSDINPDRTELYNLAKDPYEKEDLAAGEGDRVAGMLQLLKSQRERDDSDRRPDAPAGPENL